MTEVAKNKGAVIRFDEDDAALDMAPEALHLDMNMVELSLEDAIQRTKGVIQEKLKRLQAQGTDAQKVQFVYATDRYYFPEDLEKIAQNARGASNLTSQPFKQDCEKVCNDVCRCVMPKPRPPAPNQPPGPEPTNEQICKSICKWVCSI